MHFQAHPIGAEPELAPVESPRIARATLPGLNLLERLRGMRPSERLVPAGVGALLLAAAVASSVPGLTPSVAVGNTKTGQDSRMLFGGYPDRPAAAGQAEPVIADVPEADATGAYTGNGTIVNALQPAAAPTDPRTLFEKYVVQSGDTLVGIAARFHITASTLYTANKATLPNPAALKLGQTLLIPPMNCIVVTVGENDTLESLAQEYDSSTQDIVEANDLPTPLLVVGQMLIIPGAAAESLPTPTQAPATTTTSIASKVDTTKRAPTVKSGGGGSGGGSGGVTAGTINWPLAAKGYISQYFSSGHHAIDIAAPYGTHVLAALGGTVVFAGWKSYTGGGNVIWISHGGGFYTTYNHLSAWYVHVGDGVGRAQVIGAIGLSGITTGPHLHFETWLSYPWSKHTNADAVNPCRYLTRC